MNSNHPKLATSTLVTIHRTVKSFGEVNEHGPKTIAQAVRHGDLTTSSGTVYVRITVAAGPHTGANVYQDRAGAWRAQYDPTFEPANMAGA